MVGTIRKRDIIAHPFVTIQSFGWHVFLRVLVAGRHRTFLSLLAETGTLRLPAMQAPELLDRCVELELRAKEIYQQLAQRFGNCEEAAVFFRTLARQEQSHAELLNLCKAAAGRGGWDESQFAPWRNAVPRLEQQMEAATTSLESIDDLHGALHLVIQIESSEINSVFQAIVASSQSNFVTTLHAFHTAGTSHLSYIRREIARIEPKIAEQCGGLLPP